MGSMRPLLFLDLDDVVCLNSPYGGYHVLARPPPADLYEKLFSAVAAAVLLEVLEEHKPQVVMTTSWTKHMDRERVSGVLLGTGLGLVVDSLHAKWKTHQPQRMPRAMAIERWLRMHHQGEPYVVLDDDCSGTGLASSAIFSAGHVVLCRENEGLLPEHLPLLHAAFRWQRSSIS